MAVLRFYRDVLHRIIMPGGRRDSNGDYTYGDYTYGDAIECDVCPQGKAVEVTYDDGITATYSYMVYLRSGCDETFDIGEPVNIVTWSGVEINSTVKGFHKYEHSSQLWV